MEGGVLVVLVRVEGVVVKQEGLEDCGYKGDNRDQVSVAGVSLIMWKEQGIA